jgi:hypothetical protein
MEKAQDDAASVRMTKHRRKVGRPRKKPGEPVDHRLTPKMRAAIVAMVEDGLTVEAAAKVAELTPSAIYKAMKHPPAREFYTSELRMLLHCAKAQAAHALIRELKGDNAAARVAAARTLLADDAKAPIATGMPQQPGFSILIVDARAPVGQALPTNGHAPMIEVTSRSAEAAEIADGDE